MMDGHVQQERLVPVPMTGLALWARRRVTAEIEVDVQELPEPPLAA